MNNQINNLYKNFFEEPCLHKKIGLLEKEVAFLKAAEIWIWKTKQSQTDKSNFQILKKVQEKWNLVKVEKSEDFMISMKHNSLILYVMEAKPLLKRERERPSERKIYFIGNIWGTKDNCRNRYATTTSDVIM